MKSFDLIGDIHGYAEPLRLLLQNMGYTGTNGVYAHPDDRRVIFLGDYIDRGPNVRETLNIVRSMVEAGTAMAIMGNHEFNALAFHTEDGQGGHLRPHTKQNIHQHQATLDQIAKPYPDEWREWLNWFAKLPLFLELEGLRAVHAAWHSEAVDLARTLGPLTPQLVRRMVDKDSALTKMKMMLLNGPEISLPPRHFTTDKEGNQRREIRVRWWIDLQGETYQEASFPSSDSIPRSIIIQSESESSKAYPIDEVPVFFGHYWMSPSSNPNLQAPNLACLDYSVAKEGKLVAYRWDGEQKLDARKFKYVGRQQ